MGEAHPARREQGGEGRQETETAVHRKERDTETRQFGGEGRARDDEEEEKEEGETERRKQIKDRRPARNARKAGHCRMSYATFRQLPACAKNENGKLIINVRLWQLPAAAKPVAAFFT